VNAVVQEVQGQRSEYPPTCSEYLAYGYLFDPVAEKIAHSGECAYPEECA